MLSIQFCMDSWTLTNLHSYTEYKYKLLKRWSQSYVSSKYWKILWLEFDHRIVKKNSETVGYKNNDTAIFRSNPGLDQIQGHPTKNLGEVFKWKTVKKDVASFG